MQAGKFAMRTGAALFKIPEVQGRAADYKKGREISAFFAAAGAQSVERSKSRDVAPAL
tara:strand:+ start:747 stop:920 length:174 start_codon:yes stop_codon:yes gene_type:complete